MTSKLLEVFVFSLQFMLQQMSVHSNATDHHKIRVSLHVCLTKFLFGTWLKIFTYNRNFVVLTAYWRFFFRLNHFFNINIFSTTIFFLLIFLTNVFICEFAVIFFLKNFLFSPPVAIAVIHCLHHLVIPYWRYGGSGFGTSFCL